MGRRVLGGLLVAIVAWLPGAVAHADEGIAWTVAVGDNGTERPNFVYEADAGAAVEDTWVVVNAGTEPVTLSVYAADAFTTSSGQLDLQPGGETPTSVGAWVTPTVSTLTLPPGGRREVGFTLRVPADARPGDYAGGIVTAMLDESDATVQIERRLATRIHVRVPGEVTTALAVESLTARAGVALNPFAPVSVDLSYRLVNEGTGRAFAREAVAVSGVGRVALSREVPESLPATAFDRSATLSGVWALGPTRVTVEVTPEGIDGTAGAPVVAEATLWLVPWGWIGIALLGIAAVVVTVVVRSRRQWEWVEADQSDQPVG